jgi:hypothetical protein
MEYSKQVEVAVTERERDAKAAEMEAWLDDWHMPCLIRLGLGPTPTIRACFKEERFARAFELRYGGRRLNDLDLAQVMDADTEEEALFEKMAREFPD